MNGELDGIRLEVRNRVGWIRLNRPDALNALTNAMLAALLGAVSTWQSDEAVGAIVVIGEGRAFSAGQDLKEYQEGATGAIDEHLRRRYHPLITALAEFPRPTVAAVNGLAAGAGMSLATACDFRVASSAAWFSQAFVGIGLSVDSGSSYFLPRLIGRSRALRMALTGQRVDAATALAWGLVDEVVEPDQLEATAQRWGEGLAAGPPVAQRLIKQAMRFGASAGLADALAAEADWQALAAATADHREGLEAFLHKRPPRFCGR